MLDRRTVLKLGGSAAALSLGLKPVFAQTDSETLKLAVVVGMTGAYGVYAAEMKRGIDLVVEIMNNEGVQIGDKVYKISTQYYDDKTDATTAGRLVERAATSDGAHMVLASGGSAIVKANVAVAQRIKKPMMALWSQVDGVYSPQKGNPWLFSSLPPFSLMYRGLMQFQAELPSPEIKTVVMVGPNNELGIYSGDDYFPEDVKLAGLELLGVEYYPPGSNEYLTSIARARRMNPDCLVLNAYSDETVPMIKEMQSIGWFPKSVVIESPGGVAQSLGDAVNGLFVPLLWDDKIADTKDKYVGTGPDFTRLYTEKYGAAPPDFTAAIAAHDAISYVQVMQKAGVIDDSEAIRNAFLETDAETFFGPNSFDDDGLNRKAPVHAGQFQNGATTVVYPADIRSAEPIHPYPGYKG
jgi:branched-chain amino acid transport system substrate-binding protein